MFINRCNQKKCWMGGFGFAILTAVMVLAGSDQGVFAADAGQKSFKSPEEAVKTLIDATKENDTKELMAIFGPAGKELILSGDEVADQVGRDRFVKAYEMMSRVVSEDEKKAILHVGNRDWPFPIPIVKEGESWFFNTKAGKQEVLNRRIGRNELNAIQVCLAYVDAQREYTLRSRDKGGLLEYAKRLVSKEGKKDGLYWEAKEGEEQSPLGPLAAKAAKEGYGLKKSSPYHGYYYKILRAQGENAPGGAYDYVVNGKMIGGFALVAYPAEYGNSGVMTFMVNHEGAVYQKDLGKETEKMVSATKKYDPDKTWKKVE